MRTATASLNIARRPEQFVSDDSRVLLRFFEMGNAKRIKNILKRINSLTESQVDGCLEQIHDNFSARHRNVEQTFREHYDRIVQYIKYPQGINDHRKLLIGAFFSMEYSIEAAALFNPSIVMHPDQSNLPDGAARFLMSMRATGEGHISSIVFRRGILQVDNSISFDSPPKFAYSAKPCPHQLYDKRLLTLKLLEMGVYYDFLRPVINRLNDQFTIEMLQNAIQKVERQSSSHLQAFRTAANQALWLASANYSLSYPQDALPSETVIFPATENERKGMEDLRMVRFIDEDEQAYYYGTYTAYDGERTTPMMIETDDFKNFHVATLNGKFAKNKGQAFFPRKVDGWYMMISRHDGENLFILRSYNRHFWNESWPIQVPSEPWELMLIGNCGSPLETEAGWILLTHGVGPVRQYCIGAVLLDRNDPRKVIGRLRQPLLAPTSDEREGYVPNVVYSCGSMIHHDRLVIPYAMSDSRISFATVNVNELLNLLLASGP